ncbi:MAG: ATP-dependent protease ATPase subunit HslU [Spirosomataceae bacterium]
MKDYKLEQYTPHEIVDLLDKYIIGQKEAKKNVAIALRNRWRRMNSSIELQGEIVPNNILMIGSTGVGKTEIARRVAKIANAPFVKVEASKFTEVGYVGRDVESMVRDLVEQSIHLVQNEKKEFVKEKAAEFAEERILDILIPPVKQGFTLDADVNLNESTRNAFKEKLKSGSMNERLIDIEVHSRNTPEVGIFGASMDDPAMSNMLEKLGGMLPKKTVKRKVTIEEARKIFTEEEAQKLIDMEEVKREALWRAANLGIIFIDEIDKIAVSSGKSSGPDVSREGVQRDLLPIVEGSSVNTKYGPLDTQHVLFIAAGAFHVSKPSDLIPELQGRFPIRVELESLTEQDFYHILTTPKNALTKQYEALLQAEGVTLEFSDEALRALAKAAFDANVEMENIGARRLQTVMSRLLNDILFDVPEKIKPGSILKIEASLVEERLASLIQNKDLSQYIL